jgi:(4-alkanoyl-5-oxo-2,5-dihydrofuran-3-yl)methyl phosphate reductase
MILVTGATGNVGSQLVPQLLDAGAKVRVLVRDPKKVAHLGDRVERATGDLDVPESLSAAMAGVERVFRVVFSDQQHKHALEAAKRAGVKHIVELSTYEASFDEARGTGLHHHGWDAELRASGLDWTVLQPGMFMSNTLLWFAEQIKRQGAVHFPGGEGKVAPIDPRDIAAVAAAALTGTGHQGKSYRLTGPELLSMGDMTRILGEVLGKPLRYVDIPDAAFAEKMREGGTPPGVVDMIMETLSEIRTGEHAFRTDTVEKVIGRPARTFEAWCREHVAAFQ